MVRVLTKFVCQQCGYESPQWLGKCPSCESWNSLVETPKEKPSAEGDARLKGERRTPKKLQEISSREFKRLKTQIEEFDRVLGGGIVPGSVVLLAGEPGIGKSTLLLQVTGKLGGLYISGEESLEQVKMRAERLGIRNPPAGRAGQELGRRDQRSLLPQSGIKDLFLLAETNVENILEEAEKTLEGTLTPLIVDSIQTMWTQDLRGTPGSVGQVRESAAKLVQLAKRRGFPLFLVGHVTKEGAIAGPMVLAHLVDTILYFEGERYQSLRLLRVVKNRFGPTDEVGVFRMAEGGMEEIKDPSGLFLSGERQNLSGSCLVMVMEGTRPLLCEIQALVTPTKLPLPRRTASGLDFNRLQLLIAILQKRLNLPFFSSDVFVNLTGGLKVFEPAADLATCLAIVSSFKNKPLPSDLVAIGEVGLLGELRPVANLEKRIKEARRLGLKKIISSQSQRLLTEVVSQYLS